MEKRVFFEDARKNVLEFFSIEFPQLSINDVDAFISLFYKLVNYEEESQKIRPTILVTSSINSIIRNVPNSKKIVFYEDKDLSNFKARIKALMCFCKSDWNIYVSFGEETIEFGIVKTLTSIKEPALYQTLVQKSTLENISRRTSLVVINVLGGGVIQLIGAKGDRCSICFNLSSQSEYNWDSEIAEFVDACVEKIKTTPKKLEDIKTLITNLFHRVLRDSHGTICMVVDKEFKDKTGFLADGTWLKEPIEFGKLFVRSSKFDENVLRSYADVLTTMLDFDGITVIDNAGRIRAYNVFIESNNNGAHRVVGGARRRAAYTILQNKSKKIIGVYFQSQDGDNFYKEKSDLRKKKKKIKIVGGEVINEDDDILPLEIIAKLQQQKKKEEEKLIHETQEKLAKAHKKAEEDKAKTKESKTEHEKETPVQTNEIVEATELSPATITEMPIIENENNDIAIVEPLEIVETKEQPIVETTNNNQE